MHQPSFPSFLLAFATWERSPWLCLFRLLRFFVAFFSYDGENWDCINKIFASTPQASSVSELACPGKPPHTMSSASYSVLPMLSLSSRLVVHCASEWIGCLVGTVLSIVGQVTSWASLVSLHRRAMGENETWQPTRTALDPTSLVLAMVGIVDYVLSFFVSAMMVIGFGFSLSKFW